MNHRAGRGTEEDFPPSPGSLLLSSLRMFCLRGRPQRYGALDWMLTCVSMLYSAPGEAPVICEAFRSLLRQCLLCAQFLGVKEWELAPQLLPRILCPCVSRIVLVSKSDPPNPFLPTQPASPRGDIFQFSQAVRRLSLRHPVSRHGRLCPSLSRVAVSLCS